MISKYSASDLKGWQIVPNVFLFELMPDFFWSTLFLKHNLTFN